MVFIERKDKKVQAVFRDLGGRKCLVTGDEDEAAAGGKEAGLRFLQYWASTSGAEVLTNLRQGHLSPR